MGGLRGSNDAARDGAGAEYSSRPTNVPFTSWTSATRPPTSSVIRATCSVIRPPMVSVTSTRPGFRSVVRSPAWKSIEYGDEIHVIDDTGPPPALYAITSPPTVQ